MTTPETQARPPEYGGATGSTRGILALARSWRNTAVRRRSTDPHSSWAVGLEDCAAELEQLIQELSNAGLDRQEEGK